MSSICYSTVFYRAVPSQARQATRDASDVRDSGWNHLNPVSYQPHLSPFRRTNPTPPKYFPGVRICPDFRISTSAILLHSFFFPFAIIRFAHPFFSSLIPISPARIQGVLGLLIVHPPLPYETYFGLLADEKRSTRPAREARSIQYKRRQ
jgi:hypothetical protein